MGYCSNFEIKVFPASVAAEVLSRLSDLSGYTLTDSYVCDAKWYGARSHCAEATAQGDAVIVLDVTGEEQGDVWRGTYAEGKEVFYWQMRPADVPQTPKFDEYLNRAKAAGIAGRKAELERQKAEREAEIAALGGDA